MHKPAAPYPVLTYCTTLCPASYQESVLCFLRPYAPATPAPVLTYHSSGTDLPDICRRQPVY
eukprot:3233066-Rhodomonas_salina.1